MTPTHSLLILSLLLSSTLTAQPILYSRVKDAFEVATMLHWEEVRVEGVFVQQKFVMGEVGVKNFAERLGEDGVDGPLAEELSLAVQMPRKSYFMSTDIVTSVSNNKVNAGVCVFRMSPNKETNIEYYCLSASTSEVKSEMNDETLSNLHKAVKNALYRESKLIPSEILDLKAVSPAISS